MFWLAIKLHSDAFEGVLGFCHLRLMGNGPTTKSILFWALYLNQLWKRFFYILALEHQVLPGPEQPQGTVYSLHVWISDSRCFHLHNGWLWRQNLNFHPKHNLISVYKFLYFFCMYVFCHYPFIKILYFSYVKPFPQ